MTIAQIEANTTKLIKNFSQDTFIFDFLLAYGEPKATITRLKKGELNQLKSKGEVLLRKKVFFKEACEHLHGSIDTLKNTYASQRQKPRFIIVTDYKTFLAYDIKTTDTLDIDFKELVGHYDFFLPLAGMEKSIHIDENPADVKATNRLAKLYDEILKVNPTNTHEEVHALNVFLTRLLFCYFAEDSNIFESNLFTNSIANHTQTDGSDVDSYLERLFDVFNTDEKSRDNSLSKFLKAFPYVNGGLFRDKQPVPKFTAKSRNILIEIGELDWSQINPDIFGSMIQAVMTPEHRGDMGIHYTSVPNIMKVMQPLFLDELYEEFEKAKGNAKKLNLLHLRLQNLKIFDPACGSGNFLIIAYKELRKLEMLIFKEGGLLISPSIKLTQFYGIELDDFAHEVAILSLWLVEHQMNVAFKKEFGTVPPALPLKDGGNIVHGNATRIEWESVCPKKDGDEIYILGNPPYLGFKMQNKEQKEDMELVFKKVKNYKKLDYIACWFYKGAEYINNINAQYAFVSTNSISQGEQVGILWTHILKDNLEINFAYQSFKWQNNAKSNAAVIVVVIGLRNKSSKTKFLYKTNIKQAVNNINAYLVNSDNIFIQKLSRPLSSIPKMQLGNMPKDDGNFILSDEEKNNLLISNKECEPFIKRLIGAYEFLNGSQRWCFWIKEDTLNNALNIELIKNRIEKVRDFRLASTDKSANEMGKTPFKFREQHEAKKISIIIPTVTSERREYIPMGYLDKNSIVVAPNNVLYDPEPYIFGILSSKVHTLWVKAVGGKLKSDYRYSSVLCYNTFPFPNISEKQKEEITELVFTILDEREQHSEKTLAELYNPDKMPEGLKEAHHQLDLAIERCYRKKPFQSDEERLEYLFGLYEKMIRKESLK